MIRVLFVCLGNICRSPMADGVFQHLVREAGLQDHFEIDSAGTAGYHTGEAPHRGTQKVLRQHGVAYRHAARQVTAGELAGWDYVIPMDASNLGNLERMGSAKHEMRLLLDYAPETGVSEVPDPYYTGRFEEVYALVEQGCRNLLAHIRAEEGL